MALTLKYYGTSGNTSVTIPDYVPNVSTVVTPLANVNYVGTNWPPGAYSDAQVANTSNVQGYGGYVQQAVLSLTENFASTSNTIAPAISAGPANVIIGQMWVDANTTTSLVSNTFTNRSNITVRVARDTETISNPKTVFTWREIPLQNDRHMASDLFVDNRELDANDVPNIANYFSAANLADANVQVWGNGVIVLTGNASNAASNTGYLNTGNINVRGFVTSNLLPNANITYDLGSNTNRWKDIWLANSTIYIGDGRVWNPPADPANGIPDGTIVEITTGLSVRGTGGLYVDAGNTGNITFGNAATYRTTTTIGNIDLEAADSLNINSSNHVSIVSGGNYTLTSNNITTTANLNHTLNANNLALTSNNEVTISSNTLTANIAGNTNISSGSVNIESNSNAGGTTNITGGPVNVSNTFTVGSGNTATIIHAANGTIVTSNVNSTNSTVSGNLVTNQAFIGNGNIVSAYSNGLVTIGFGANMISLNGGTGAVNTANANAEVPARGPQWALQFNSGNVSNGILTGSNSITWNDTANSFYVNGTANIRGMSTFGNGVTVEGTSNLITRTITTGAAATGGTITGQWSLTTGSTLEATYADLAERYTTDADYPVGTVLVFGGTHEVTQSTHVADHRVAGVVSNTAAYIMNSDLENSIVVALRGRVPVLVSGPVKKGDLLITSSVTGHAQSVGSDASYGCKIFAKSLEEDPTTGTKMIEAVIL